MMTACLFSQSAAAQEWERFENRALQFTINFPGDPRIENAVYTAADGTEIPAQVFSMEFGSALYKLTVADFSGHPQEARGATAHAAHAIMARGEGIHNRYGYMDGLPGHDLSVEEPNGRRLQAVVYLFDRRLYIVEGSDFIEAPPTTPFVYSLIITHADGTQLNLDGYNADEFNPFESAY